MIGIHDPQLSEAEISAVTAAARSGWLSGGGGAGVAFETELQRFFGAAHAPAAVVNGSAALVLALRSLGVEAGDQVLVSRYGFVATANAIPFVGAEPIFLGPAPGEIPVVGYDDVAFFLEESITPTGHHRATGKRVRGLLYNEPFGFACRRLPEIARLLAARGMFLIEDASQAFGAKLGDRYLGTIGDAGVFSFNGNKTLALGSGGALLAREEATLARARKLRHHARSDDFEFFYDELGYNFQLPSLLAALGVSQCRRLPEILRAKENIRAAYREFFRGTKIRLVGDENFPAWLNVAWLPSRADDRALVRELAHRLRADGVQIRPVFPPVTDYPMYRSAICQGGDARAFYEHAICLPSGAGISAGQVERVAHFLVLRASELGLA